jgi:WD40-like Beta Propeller Repeat
VSADGQRSSALCGSQSLQRVAVTFDRPVALEPITDGFSGDVAPEWSQDGSRLVFASSRSGNRTLWTMDASFSHPAPLTIGARSTSGLPIRPMANKSRSCPIEEANAASGWSAPRVASGIFIGLGDIVMGLDRRHQLQLRPQITDALAESL